MEVLLRGGQFDVQLLPQCFRPFVQRGERGVQGFAGFQAGEGRRVDLHSLGDFRQGRHSIAAAAGGMQGTNLL
jgi:hypothetical protein